MKKLNTHSTIARIAFLFLAMLIIIGLTACEKPPSETSYLEFSAYSAKKQYKVSGRDADNFAPKLSSLIIDIKTTANKRIVRFDILKQKELKIAVPSNTRLLVTGVGFIAATIEYEGKILIEPIRPGNSATANLILQSVDDNNQELQVDIAVDEQPSNGRSKGLRFFGDGNYILFASDSSNLVVDDSNEAGDIYFKNLGTFEIKNLHSNLQGDLGVSEVPTDVADADISEDGAYVVFSSTADNLVEGDTNSVADIFLKNVTSNEIERISLNDGSQIEWPSTNPQISDDGTIVSYQTQNGEDSTENTIQLFNRLTKQRTELRRDNTDSGAVSSTHFILSGDGEWIVYQTPDEQLKLFNVSSKEDRFISEEMLGYSFNITQDGSAIAFIPSNSGGKLTENQFYIFTYANNRTRQYSKNPSGADLSNNLTQTTLPAISGNGRYIAVSYDDTIYLFETEYNNFTQFSGSDPFLSIDGAKIGYSKEDNLFSIENPIYSDRAVIEKAAAPTEVIVTSFLGGFNLEWTSVENATFYRVFQTTEIDTTVRDIGLRERDESRVQIYETTNSSLIIDTGLTNGTEYFFTVAAINDSGLSGLSDKVSAIANIDEIPPTVESISSPSTVEYVRERRIALNFSENIQPDTANTNNIRLFDSQDKPITLSSVSTLGSQVRLTTSIDLQYGETYTIRISTGITDLVGNALQSIYQNSFTTWLPPNEGTLEAPVLINEGIYNGKVGLGTSIYQLNTQTILVDRYLIRIISSSANISSNLIGREGGNIAPQQNNANAYLVSYGSFPADELTLSVFGSETERGATFSIEVLGVDNVDFSDGGIIPLTTLAAVDSTESIVLSGLSFGDETYALDFSLLGTSQIRVSTLFDNSMDCLISSANPVCEVNANAIQNGELYLSIRGVSNISDLAVTAELLRVITVIQEQPLRINDEYIFALSSVTLYKNSNLDFNRSHALLFDTAAGENTETTIDTTIETSSSYRLFTNNWRNLECSNAISYAVDETCIFKPSPTDSSFYLRIENTNPEEELAIKTILVYAYDVDELPIFTILNDETIEYFAVAGLKETTNYTVTLSSDVITNGLLEIMNALGGDCSEIHDSPSISCDVYTDPSGILYVSFGNSDREATMNISIEEAVIVPILNSVSSPSTTMYAYENTVVLTFSENILASTANEDTIKLFLNSQKILITVDTLDNIVTLTSEGNFQYDEQYQVTISTSVSDLLGNFLPEAYDESFFTWSPPDEGTLENPIPITGRYYQGTVGRGTSFYRFNTPAQPAEQYLIELYSFGEDANLSYNLVDNTDTSYVNQTPDSYVTTYFVSSTDLSSLTLSVNELYEIGGAIFSIEILGINNVDFSEAGTIQLPILATENSVENIVISNLFLEGDYALDFSLLGTSQIRMSTLFNNGMDCLISSANPVCEVNANAIQNGELYLSIRGVSNISDLEVTAELLYITTDIQSPPLRRFTAEIPTSSNVTLYKYTNLVPERNHALLLNTELNGTSRYTLYTNNWNTVECSNEINTIIDDTCVFTAPLTDNSYYLRIENRAPIQYSTVTTDLVYAYDVDELTSFIIENNETTEYFAVSGLTGNTGYTITLSSNTLTNGSLSSASITSDGGCSATHSSPSVTCNTYTDPSGMLYFSFGNSSVDTVMNLLIEQTPLNMVGRSISLDTTSQYSISPSESFIVNPISSDTPYLVHATVHLSESSGGLSPLLTVLDNTQSPDCRASRPFGFFELACLVYPGDTFLQFTVEDGTAGQTGQFPKEYASITVSEVAIINLDKTPYSATVDSSFAVYTIDNPIGAGLNITLTGNVADTGFSPRIRFSLHSDANLTNPICSSNWVALPGTGNYEERCEVGRTGTLTPFYMLVNTLDAPVGEAYTIDFFTPQ